MATKKQKLTEMKTLELHELLAKQQEELRVLRFSSAGGRPKDSAAPQKTRKQIARIFTELHARKTAAMLGTAANA
jgi:ribosomal protein L29